MTFCSRRVWASPTIDIVDIQESLVHSPRLLGHTLHVWLPKVKTAKPLLDSWHKDIETRKNQTKKKQHQSFETLWGRGRNPLKFYRNPLCPGPEKPTAAVLRVVKNVTEPCEAHKAPRSGCFCWAGSSETRLVGLKGWRTWGVWRV